MYTPKLTPVEMKQLTYLLEEQIRKIASQAAQHKKAGRENISSLLENGIKEMQGLKAKLRIES